MSQSKKVGTWDQLRMSPAQLMKLVIQGKANITGRDKYGRHIYELVERGKEIKED